MIYLTDKILEKIPEDSEKIIWIDNIESPREEYESLPVELQEMNDLGAKVQYWHMENNFPDFRLISKDFRRYNKFVSSSRFVEV